MLQQFVDTVVGAPASWQIRVFAVRLARREPALDEILPQADLAWPATVAEVKRLIRSHRCDAAMIAAGSTLLELPECGSYIVVPVWRNPGGEVPLLDAALLVEVAVPGSTLEATIRIDPERARAAPR